MSMLTLKVVDLSNADRETQNTILNELVAKLEALIRLSAGQYAGAAQDEAFIAYAMHKFTRSTLFFFLALATIAHCKRTDSAKLTILIARLEMATRKPIQVH